ncbi:zinc finger protein RFP-like isoform X2 [Hemicordylus capensis]|nr:zinc finger protein RFP-like isoform X2 [Hemicordylus capensis]XP_053148521.1 zinc finger protein RFP-like isoform X2 [Hemicordylus capensis]
MAAGGPVEELCDETTCPICLEYFKDPVIIDCGHNFCRACLIQYWRESDRVVSCAQCRETFQQKNFRPNRQLANVVEIIRKLEKEKQAERKGGECAKHQEVLKLFCKDDEDLICLVCEKSKEHKGHDVVPVEEIAQEFKEKITVRMKSLEKQREHIVALKLAEELGSKKCLTYLEKEKKKIKSVFEEMHRFIEEKEHLWLTQLEDLKKDFEERHQEIVTRLSAEISRLSNLITEMEGKFQQPPQEFLQDIRITLSRYKKQQVEHATDSSPFLEQRITSHSQKKFPLEKAMKKYKVNVTLDPDTANPWLVLSEDLKNVKWGSRKDNLPESPARFDVETCVLGCERFASGRHWWEVEVEEDGNEKLTMWAVGVTRESVRRKRLESISSNEGIWAVGKPLDVSFPPHHLRAFTSPKETHVALKHDVKKIRVSLDYEEGCVEFFDANTNDLIFVFASAPFSGERLCPFFQLFLGVRLKC